MDAEFALLKRLYDRFNARDIDGVLAHMSDDVEWPKAFEGGYVQGHEAIREYWTRQWGEIDPTVVPAGVDVDGKRVTVHVDAATGTTDASGVALPVGSPPAERCEPGTARPQTTPHRRRTAGPERRHRPRRRSPVRRTARRWTRP